MCVSKKCNKDPFVTIKNNNWDDRHTPKNEEVLHKKH